MAARIPVILIFSFFAANLLNQKFPGRTLARVIFFLPVVMSAEIVLKMQQADYMQQAMSLSESGLIPLSVLRESLVSLKLPLVFVNFIFEAINQVPVIIRSSGIQILIFLAALQSISPSLYEAADMEGHCLGVFKIIFRRFTSMLVNGIT